VKAFITVAVRTGVWLPSQVAMTAGQPVAADHLFSAEDLAGAVTSASLLSVDERPDLRPDANRALPPSLSVPTSVVGIQTRERDIDGCTVIVEVDLAGVPSWSDIAGVSDAMVAWVSRSLASEVSPRRSLQLGSQEQSPTALWSHTVIACLEGMAATDHACSPQTARALLPTGFEVVQEGPNALYLALHASLFCMRSEQALGRLVDIMDELHGWWSGSWVMDQSLLRTALSMASTLSDHRITEIRGAADLLATVTGEVGILRSRVDTYRLSLGGLEWPVWNAASTRWALSDNLEALERKRQLLLDMTTSFRGAIEAHRATRLNHFAGFFALVSSLASFVAVVLFVFPALDRPDAHLLARVLVTCVALAITLVGLFWSSAYMLRLSRDRRARLSAPDHGWRV
jgi:hypothetical protein